MAIRSGLNSQIGYAAEATWGTSATPTRFLEFNSESMKLDVQRIESQGLRATNRVLRSDRWAANKKGVTGDVEHEVQSKGFGLLFKHALGTVSIATTASGTNSKDHTHTLGDPYGLGLTCQVGRPDVSGTVQPFTYTGCKVTEWELSNEVDGILMWRMGLDGQDEATATALATASYVASTELLTYVGGTITVAGSSFDLTNFSLKGANGLKTDRHFVRASVLKKEQIAAQSVELSGQIEAEFESLTAYTRFTAGTTAAIVAKWEGTTIEASSKYTVQVTLPVVRFDGETPNVSGPDVLMQSLPFKVLYDGTQEPLSLLYRTTDVAS